MRWQPRVARLNNMLTIGSAYGSWTIPDGVITDHSVCYLAGAGEDISFDTGLVERYRCAVFLLDPTPRARVHFDTVIAGARNGTRIPVNNSTTEYYRLSPQHADRLTFLNLGLWDQDDDLRFYSPKNPSHVSHSALNLQKTTDFFTARVERLSHLMQRMGHTAIDLLKIDIEGAEYKVLDSILEDRVRVRILCVEYDEAHNALAGNYLRRIRSSVTRLVQAGYTVVHATEDHNYTFLRNDVFSLLSGKSIH
jgi:FkbM family methyltransferase